MNPPPPKKKNFSEEVQVKTLDRASEEIDSGTTLLDSENNQLWVI